MSVDDVPVILDLIRALKNEADKIILLVEHKMDVVRELADRIIVLHNGQLVADGEPAAGDRVADRPAGLSRRCRRGARMTSPLLQLQGVHTHIGAYHILHGVNFDVPAGQVTMLLGRNGAGKTTTLRTIMGLWPTARGTVRSTARRSAAWALNAATPDIARLGIAYVPENMGIFRDLSVSENMLLAARARAPSTTSTRSASMAVRPVPGAEEVLALSGRQAVGRPEADARDRARDGRAAPPAADRRAEQGPRAGDRAEPDRGAARAEAHRDDGPAGRAELRDGEGARRPVAVMDDGRVVHRGPMAELAEDEGCSTACSASRWPRTNERRRSRMTTLATPAPAAEAIPKSRFDTRPLALMAVLALGRRGRSSARPSTWLTLTIAGLAMG
jgi:branched-chain amino acid transport system ATP-binding protein